MLTHIDHPTPTQHDPLEYFHTRHLGNLETCEEVTLAPKMHGGLVIQPVPFTAIGSSVFRSLAWLHRTQQSLGISLFVGGANEKRPVEVVNFAGCVANREDSDVEDRACDIYLSVYGVGNTEDEG